MARRSTRASGSVAPFPRLLTPALLLAFALPALQAGALAAQEAPSDAPKAHRPGPLAFQYLGPDDGGRIIAAAGVPGSRDVFYLGAASGGVWKTTDGGKTFAPVFDDQPVQSVGALAVAPSDPDVVWAGTGEAFAIRDADMMGDGVYRSTDGGATWTHMGLTGTGRIGRIVIHPTNPDIVYVCALGRTTGDQPERGVFRTTDGGKSWNRVLFVDPGTGCSGLAMDPSDPDVLFAGTWSVTMHTWVMNTGGPGSGVWVTRDGGDTWARLGAEAGLPKPPFGKVDVAIAPSDPARVYALIQTAGQGSVWRSEDGGRSWKLASRDRTLIGRAGYYVRLAVNPGNADELLVMSSSPHLSTDGGKSWPATKGCGDCHDVWIDPLDPDHWIVTGDGGAGVTADHGKSFSRVQLPIGQMYHLALDARVPYWVYSNRQDDGTLRGPSDQPVRVRNVPSYAPYAPDASREGPGPHGRAAWQGGLGGCESGFTLPAAHDPHVVWSSCYGGEVTRYDDRLGRARSVSPWIHTLDSPPADLKYRCHWTPPLAADPFAPETMYFGCQVVFETDDGGQTWRPISPDLSTRDSSRIAFSGDIPGAEPPHLLGDNLGQYYGEVVFAIAPSKVARGLLWAGTNDGLVWLTRDGGKHWTDVTPDIPDLPPWGTVRKIAPSPFDPAAAYVAVDFHLMDDRDPYIYRTGDFGKTWTRIDGGLPRGHPLDYALAVTENPNRKGMLFAGTGHAFYYSLDDGGSWTRLRGKLPAAPVTWIEVEPRYHDVVISTYGRGLWVLRDITRLEQADRVPAGAAAWLYGPRPGFRRAESGSASFLYRLNTAPAGPVRFEITDSAGAPVRTLLARGVPGLNSLTWNLLYDGPEQVALRTTPPFNPDIWNEARFRGKTTRPIVHWGIEGPQHRGPIAAPGRYTVRMIAGADTLRRPFTVLKDPAIPSPTADLRASTRAQLRVRDGMSAVADMTNRIEIMRKQIQDLRAGRGAVGGEGAGGQGPVAGEPRPTGQTGQAAQAPPPEVAAALDSLDADMRLVERHFLSKTDMYSDDKWYVESYRLYMQYIWLSAEVGLGGGDVAGGAAYRPTSAALAWLGRLESELAGAKTDFEKLVDERVPAFNRSMAGRIPAIQVPESGKEEGE
jgi:photosystem II stability/assembly factor-like uncharacterized protein